MSPDTVVIGGGIAGLTIALSLGDAGHQVSLLDDPRPGAASHASAGMLAPSLGFPEAMLEHALSARDLYPSFLVQLEEWSGIAVPLDRRGILEVATTEAEGIALHARTEEAFKGTWFDAAELARLEPALGGHAGAILHPLDGAVEIATLMDALSTAVGRHQRIRVISASVVSLAFDGGSAAAVTADRGREQGKHVVLAGGGWTGSIAGLPRPIPVQPVKGELLVLDGPAVGHVIHGAGGYLVPRREGLLVGATSEDAGFDATPTDAGRARLLQTARRLLPRLTHPTVTRQWGGIRPISPDGLPIVGRDPAQPKLVYACGLSRNGILLAPWIARQIAEELGGRAPETLRSFGIERFTSHGALTSSP